MELSILLMKKIISMALIVLIGYMAVKKNIAKEEDTEALSALCLYIICPCTLISAFQMEYDADKLQNLIYCFAAAFAIHIIFVAVTWVLSKTERIDPVQQDSLVYSNCGNLILPIISSMLGSDAVFYACAYIAVQNIFVWTHGMYTIGGAEKINIKKILLNPNILSIAAGLILFLGGVSLPMPVSDAVDALGSMIGPMGMLIAGIIMASVDLKAVFTSLYAYTICFLRLMVYPFIVILVLWLTRVTVIIPDSAELFLVPFLGAVGPTASTVTQMARLNDCDFHGASITNVMSIILCIITMPVMIFIYQMFLY